MLPSAFALILPGSLFLPASGLSDNRAALLAMENQVS